MPLKDWDREIMELMFKIEETPRVRKRAYRRKYHKFMARYVPNHHFADSQGLVMEHRLVWELYHKAVLLPWARIYHRNRDKADNRIENLEIKLPKYIDTKVDTKLRQELPILLKKMGL